MSTNKLGSKFLIITLYISHTKAQSMKAIIAWPIGLIMYTIGLVIKSLIDLFSIFKSSNIQVNRVGLSDGYKDGQAFGDEMKDIMAQAKAKAETETPATAQ